MFDELATFDGLVRRWLSKPLSECRVFEIGFGARPFMLLAAQAMGADAHGVDAEVPIIRGRPSEYAAMLRSNGWERLLKTAVRRLLFDTKEQARFKRALDQRGLRVIELNPDRLLVGDAAHCSPTGKFDVVYSTFVFEHIELRSLEQLLPRMANWLTAEGVALIRPDVFTGLRGGHIVDPEAEPWEHLRKRRFQSNTCLNQLTRGEYKTLFERHFEILDIVDPPRDESCAQLTPEIRTELAGYTEEDLLDGLPLFVLRPRSV